jgi:hypothetical protein
MAVDYGNDYATILPGGRLILDLSASRLTGPMVPVVRVARTWLESALANAIERTWRPPELGALGARLKVLGEQVEHVLRVEATATLGASKALVAHGRITVGGAGIYPLVVTVDGLTEALITIGA